MLILIAKIASRFNKEHIYIAKVNLDLVYAKQLNTLEKKEYNL